MNNLSPMNLKESNKPDEHGQAFWNALLGCTSNDSQTPLPKSLISCEDQLKQLMQVTWDGNLISKADRDNLVLYGFAQRYKGWNLITIAGLSYLSDHKLIHP